MDWIAVPIEKNREDRYAHLMTGFFLKKAFFDSWDNLIALVVLNLAYLPVLLVVYGGLEMLAVNTAGGIAILLVALLLHAFLGSAISAQTMEHANYSRPGFALFMSSLRTLYRHAVVHALILLILLVMALFIIPFYLSHGTFITFAIAVLVFWVLLATSMAMMYYYPLATHMPKDRPLKTLRKSFLLVADNLGFSLLLALHHLVNLVLTLLFATIMPGVAGISLSRQVAVKLLMLKYDWLEEHPEGNRKDVPWEELLYEERERVGKRTLKGMIFPWKE